MTVDKKSKYSNLQSTVTVSSQIFSWYFLSKDWLFISQHDGFFFLFEYNQPENMEFLRAQNLRQK